MKSEAVTEARAWAKKNAKWLAGVHLRPTSRAASDYGLPDAAVAALTPFLVTGDGSSVALWGKGAQHEIVLLGSEGENLWLAGSIAAFEANLPGEAQRPVRRGR